MTVKTPLCFCCVEDDEKALNPCRQRLVSLDLHGAIAAGTDEMERKTFKKPLTIYLFKKMTITTKYINLERLKLSTRVYRSMTLIYSGPLNSD